MKNVIGIDLGTSGVKLLLVSEKGKSSPPIRKPTRSLTHMMVGASRTRFYGAELFLAA